MTLRERAQAAHDIHHAAGEALREVEADRRQATKLEDFNEAVVKAEFFHGSSSKCPTKVDGITFDYLEGELVAAISTGCDAEHFAQVPVSSLSDLGEALMNPPPCLLCFTPCGRVGGVESLIGQPASLRRRMNITSTSKGVLSFETTVDGTGTIDELLAELDAQVGRPQGAHAARGGGMNRLPTYEVRWPWWDVADKWQIQGSLLEALHDRSVEHVDAEGHFNFTNDQLNEIGSEVRFDDATQEFRVIVDCPFWSML